MIILPFLALGSLLFYLRYYRGHIYAPFIEKLAIYSILYMVYTGFSFPTDPSGAIPKKSHSISVITLTSITKIVSGRSAQLGS